MKKFCVWVVAALAVLSFGRVGPVSQYGQLQAGKNSGGKGQIYGACKGVSSGNEVAVQGMSLFWSISSDVGAPFWTAEHINKLVNEQNIQLIRAPMGVDEDWYAGNYFTNTGYYQGLMNTMVQAAIDNDIYVIIDYHSHHAADDANKAKTFFDTMAKRWGKYDNVIFEIFNEPLQEQSWGSIKTYADEVVKTIRQYSDNLIVVGNRSWDQYPNEAASSPVADSKNNIAYTFHYYAGSHYTDREGSNAVSAMNSGLSVFVTEWGTVDASGNGGYSAGNSKTWLDWMNKHKLSGANWSVSNKPESASYYTGGMDNLSYSTSGQWVNANVFASLPKSYTACDGAPASSSSIASSSSSLPAGYTDYIDDLEDGDGFAFTGGEWYAYTDAGDKGASTISNGPGRNDGYNVVIAGSTAGNSTKYVAGVTGVKLSQGSNPYDPYVALGVALNETQTAYDLSACKEISYKYKGAAHNFKAEDTAVTDYGYHMITKPASNSWTTATVPWDMLSQESWAKPVTLSKKRVAKFTWEIKGTQPSMNYLYVDDVRCSGMAFKPVPSPASSSSSVKSSSSVASSSSVRSSSSSIPSSSSLSSSSVMSSISIRSSSSVQPPSSSSEESSSSVVPVSSSSEESFSSEESSSSEFIIVESSSSKDVPPSSSSEAPSSSSEVPSSSSVKSSSSIVSSSSEQSSSSVESSSSIVPSSSSVIPSSSSNMQVVVTGSLEQTVERGAAFETITFSNVQTFERNTWNLWFMEFKRTGEVVTVEGSVHASFTPGTAVETVTVNGQKFNISFVVVLPASSSSSSSESPASSSSEASSSSVEPGSSSSEMQPESSSSEGPLFVTSRSMSALSLNVAGRTLHVAGAPDMSVEVFDMQGTPVASFGHVSSSVSLDALCQGSYVVRLRSGSLSMIRRILVK